MVTTRAIKAVRAEQVKELARPLKHNADKFYTAHLLAKADKQAETTAEREKLNAHHMDVLGWVALHLRNVFESAGTLDMTQPTLTAQRDLEVPISLVQKVPQTIMALVIESILYENLMTGWCVSRVTIKVVEDEDAVGSVHGCYPNAGDHTDILRVTAVFIPRVALFDLTD